MYIWEDRVSGDMAWLNPPLELSQSVLEEHNSLLVPCRLPECPYVRVNAYYVENIIQLKVWTLQEVKLISFGR